jgi:SET domain-containing protein
VPRSFRIGRSNTGLGLFATKAISKGDYIVAYRGPMLTNAEAEKLEDRGSKYMFEVSSRWTIDGSPRWNVARYANHSCKPNAETRVARRKVRLHAIRKIAPGEEITYNYGRDYVSWFIKPHGCKCAACLDGTSRTAKRLAEQRAVAKRAKAAAKKPPKTRADKRAAKRR